VFRKPEREKGREVLRVDDALWTYLPSVGKSLRIADRDSFAGGDFSNADILRVDWTAKYSTSLAKETPNQWIFDLVAKTPEAAYARMRLWVDKKTRQPIQQYYYDSSGTLLKRCQYGSVQDFGGVTRPAFLHMENVVTTQKTELRVLRLTTGQRFPDSRFAVDNLGK
jgi:outer membrane lipoprotein-sorting protein